MDQSQNIPVASAFASLSPDSVIIIETLNEGLQKHKDESNEIYLEGTAAVFGVKNNNNRIYEKAEYLPHLQYLNEKITRGQLLGEMDHPQNFDVSLKNVSHVIEALGYDEGSNTVKIKVRLLDTPLGKIAKTLVEAGCTISISSRAAGQVMNEGKVKLHRIFTYDLVAEPGFSQAMLKRGINESVDNQFVSITESFENYKKTDIFNKLVDVSESYNFGPEVKIYKSKTEAVKTTPVVENNTTPMSTEFVKRNEFNQYSETLKKKYSILEGKIAEITENKDGEVDTKGLVAYTNYLAEELKNAILFINHVASITEKNIQYTEHVAEKVNHTIDYSDYLGEKVNQSIKFGDYLSTKLNENVNYAQYVAKKLNETINFSDYLAETLDKGIQYADFIGENVNNSIEYQDYLGEKINLGIKYSQYVAENLDKNIAFANYIVEGLNEQKLAPVAATATATQKLNEATQTILGEGIDESSDIDAITKAVAAVAKRVESNTADAVLESQYPFLKLMSKANRDAFGALDVNVKTAVVKTLGTAVWTNEAEIVNIVNAVVEKTNENVPAYVKYAPVKFKEIYEAMTDGEKNRLASQASTFQLNTPYQVKNFWETRNVEGISERIAHAKNINNNPQQVNESQSPEGYIPLNQVADIQRGYSQAFVDRFIKK